MEDEIKERLWKYGLLTTAALGTWGSIEILENMTKSHGMLIDTMQIISTSLVSSKLSNFIFKYDQAGRTAAKMLSWVPTGIYTISPFF